MQKYIIDDAHGGIVMTSQGQQGALAVPNEKLLEQFSPQLNYLLRSLRLANNQWWSTEHRN